MKHFWDWLTHLVEDPPGDDYYFCGICGYVLMRRSMQPFEVEKGVSLQQFSCYRSAFTVPKKTKRLTSAKVFKDHAKASANLAEDRHLQYTT